MSIVEFVRTMLNLILPKINKKHWNFHCFLVFIISLSPVWLSNLDSDLSIDNIVRLDSADSKIGSQAAVKKVLELRQKWKYKNFSHTFQIWAICTALSRTCSYMELSEVRHSYPECPNPNMDTIPWLYKSLESRNETKISDEKWRSVKSK